MSIFSSAQDHILQVFLPFRSSKEGGRKEKGRREGEKEKEGEKGEGEKRTETEGEMGRDQPDETIARQAPPLFPR